MARLPACLALTALLLLPGCPAQQPGPPAVSDDPTPARTVKAEPVAAEAPVPGARPRQRGVSWVAGPQEVTVESFDSLVAVGAEWIAQTPFGWQDRVDSPQVRLVTSGRVYWGERDEGLEVTTRLARERGIRTLLKPHVWLRRRESGEWRGEIAMRSEEDWRAWFESYRELVLHYARLAERLEIPALAVGTELHATARDRPEDWRRIIREVREVYSGQLTYAANWYGEIEDVTFWDELDFIGVQAYFPSGDERLPTVEALVAGWRPHVERLEALHRETGKPIVFTEMGYVSREGATVDPWTWPERAHGQPRPLASEAGLELQARAYEAFFRALWDRPWFAGVYVWKWHPTIPAGEPNPYLGFTPQGKPAEEVLRRWFREGSGSRAVAGR